jgi:hypothetical protein
MQRERTILALHLVGEFKWSSQHLDLYGSSAQVIMQWLLNVVMRITRRKIGRPLGFLPLRNGKQHL